MLRPDLQALADLISPQTKVLDLGCDDGALLEYLVQEKKVTGRGVEISEDGVLACVRRGLSVRQGNLQEGLADYPDGMFDTVVLSQTLPYLNNPSFMLQEMLRVGQQGIVSFTNWGYWRCRLQFLLRGMAPDSPDIPQVWHGESRYQTFTIADFRRLMGQLGLQIVRERFVAGGEIIGRYENLRAQTAVFVLSH